jgi:hypothetical protein
MPRLLEWILVAGCIGSFPAHAATAEQHCNEMIKLAQNQAKNYRAGYSMIDAIRFATKFGGYPSLDQDDVKAVSTIVYTETQGPDAAIMEIALYCSSQKP